MKPRASPTHETFQRLLNYRRHDNRIYLTDTRQIPTVLTHSDRPSTRSAVHISRSCPDLVLGVAGFDLQGMKTAVGERRFDAEHVLRTEVVGDRNDRGAEVGARRSE